MCYQFIRIILLFFLCCLLNTWLNVVGIGICLLTGMSDVIKITLVYLIDPYTVCCIVNSCIRSLRSERGFVVLICSTKVASSGSLLTFRRLLLNLCEIIVNTEMRDKVMNISYPRFVIIHVTRRCFRKLRYNTRTTYAGDESIITSAGGKSGSCWSIIFWRLQRWIFVYIGQ